jgi:Undecaprenyl-phosphate glucose phosphotransferase
MCCERYQPMSAVQPLRNITGEKTKRAMRRNRSVSATRARWTILIALLEFLVISVTAYISDVVYSELIYKFVGRPEVYVPFSVALALFYFFTCLIDGQYDLLGEKWKKHGVSRGVGAIALAFVFFLALIFILGWNFYFSRGTFLAQLIFVTSAVIVTRVILSQRLERAGRSGQFPGHRIIFISTAVNYPLIDYSSKLCAESDTIIRWHNIDVSQSESTKKDQQHLISEKIDNIRNECRKVGADLIIVIYRSTHQNVVEKIVEAFYESPVQIRLLPVGMIPFMQWSRVIETGKFMTLEISTQPFSIFNRFLKRAFDLIIASLAIILLSPLMILAAIAIKLDSPGPLLFYQKRHGFNNEPINVIKFRTMKVSNGKERFRQTAKNDPRFTKVGCLLRQTNIDELPQLFNVLRGEMSVVGPRPHATIHNEMFADKVKMIYRRHNVKPGITGWAQVNGLRGATDTCEEMQKRIEFDLYYIDHWSIFFDIKILLMTILSRKVYMNAY